MMKKSVVYASDTVFHAYLQKLNDFLEAAFNEGLITDGLVATDLTKASTI